MSLKIFSFLFLVTFSLYGLSQTEQVLLFEDFSTVDDVIVYDQESDNVTGSVVDKAQLELVKDRQFRMESLVVPIPDDEAVYDVFLQFDHYARTTGETRGKWYYSLNGGTDWTEAVSPPNYPYRSSSYQEWQGENPTMVSERITLAGIPNSAEFKVKFQPFSGNTGTIEWHIDNLQISVKPKICDLSFMLDNYYCVGEGIMANGVLTPTEGETTLPIWTLVNTTTQTTIYESNPQSYFTYPILNYPELGDGSYVLTASATNSGCHNQISHSESFVINSPANYVISPSGTNFSCDEITFAINGTLENGMWSFGDGFTTFDESPTHAYLDNGSYTVVYTASNFGCPITKNITVSGIPEADFSYVHNPCDPSAGVTATINPFNSDDFVYFWQVNSGSIVYAAEETMLLTGFNPGNNTLKLHITNRDNPDCETEITQSINFGGVPASFGFPGAGCVGTLYPTSVASGGSTYTWSVTPAVDISSVNAQYPAFTFDQPGTYTINLLMQSGNSICAATSQSRVITISTRPVADFTYTASSDNCAEINIAITSTSQSIGSYTIDYGDGTIISGNAVSVAAIASNHPTDLIHNYTSNGIFHVVVTLNHNSCEDSYEQIVQINSFSGVTAVGQSYFCDGFNTSLGAVLSGNLQGQGSVTYQWQKKDLDDNFVDVPGATGANFTCSLEGVYRVIASGTVGLCLNAAVSNEINVIKAEVPALTYTTTGAACNTNNGKVTLTVSNMSNYLVNGVLVDESPSLIENLGPGEFYFTVSNSVYPACRVENYAVITAPNPVSYQKVITATKCSSATGEIDLTSLVNYASSKLFDANNNQVGSGEPYSALSEGTYRLEVTSNAGCVVVEQVIIPHLAMAVVVGDASLILCPGSTGTQAVVTGMIPNSGLGTLTYAWENEGQPLTEASNTLSITTAGSYSVTVNSSVTGCSASANISVEEAKGMSVAIQADRFCAGDNVTLNAFINGGVAPYTYFWDNSISPQTETYSVATTTLPKIVTLEVVDAQNCNSAIVSYTLSGTPLTLDNPAYSINDCDFYGEASGGQTPYTFEWYFTGEVFTETVVLSFTYNAATNTLKRDDNSNVVEKPDHASNTTDVITLANAKKLEYQNLPTTGKHPVYFSFPYHANNPYTQWYYGLDSDNTVGSEAFYPDLGADGPVDVQYSVQSTGDRLQHSHSGKTSTSNFVDATYKVVVRDANGCETRGIAVVDVPVTVKNAPQFKFVFTNKETIPDPPPVEVDEDLVENMAEASNELMSAMQNCMAAYTEQLEGNLSSCFELSSLEDEMTISYSENIYHYTLSYYDRAGALIKTASPEGVVTFSKPQIDEVINYRKTGTLSSQVDPEDLLPDHRLTFRYRYNGIGQLTWLWSNDGDATTFIYDGKNRLRFSQNADQKVTGKYSYIKYDNLGRTVEAGESSQNGPDLDATNLETLSQLNNQLLANNMSFPQNQRSEIITNVYTLSGPVDYYGQPQRFLNNNISYVTKDYDPNVAGDEYITYYSYDPHGNVEWMVQEHPQIGRNTLSYEYDLISGKMLKVIYNENRPDAFFHRYSYNGENNLIMVETSPDGVLWDKDATIEHYEHGPQKRVVLGDDKVQGLDYLYTAQGWLKSINTPALNNLKDPGHDGGLISQFLETGQVAEDIFGMSLGYFRGDYVRTSPSFHTDYEELYLGTAPPTKDLYNGNVAHWENSRLVGTGNKSNHVNASVYAYDVLNRLKDAANYESALDPITREKNNSFAKGYQRQFDSNTNTFIDNDAFQENYVYDANGNIKSLSRKDELGNSLDNFTYKYDPSGRKNQLLSLIENEMNTDGSKGDIIDGLHSYIYDNRGNLLEENYKENYGSTECDVKLNMTWTVTGKVSSILKSVDDGSQIIGIEELHFYYDAMDIRVRKEAKKHYDIQGVPANYAYTILEINNTYYVQDATGYPMAVYEKQVKQDSQDPLTYNIDMKLLEHSIYGTNRIGQDRKEVTVAQGTTQNLYDLASLNDLVLPESGINKISEYQNWITSANKTTAIGEGIDQICNCKVKKLSYDLTNDVNDATGTKDYLDNPSLSEMTAFLGVADNGVAIAENLDRQTQFYVVLAKNYLGQKDACLVYTTDGQLMEGTENILDVDASSKPVIVNLTGSSKYAIVTLKNNGLPSYHVVDMGQSSFGGMASGKVVESNLPLSANTPIGTQYSYHYTGYEDHINERTIVYTVRSTPIAGQPGQAMAEVMAYELYKESMHVPAEYILYSENACGDQKQGEVQISPEGDKLLWYKHDRNISAFDHREAELYKFNLGMDKISFVSAPEINLPTIQAGNYGRGMAEFMENNNSILYSQHGVFGTTPESNKNLWRYQTVSPSLVSLNPANTYLFSQIKRGVNGTYYLPDMDSPIDKMHTYRTGNTPDEAIYKQAYGIGEASYSYGASLPTQVFKVFTTGQVQMLFTRTVGRKMYELTDHLNNVRVVISDRKILHDEDADNAVSEHDYFIVELMSYSDYYPFGMQQPGRHYTNEKYRYGFNGMESDNETKGSGNSYTTEFRQYDPRIGRWLSLDPMAQKYPGLSPYVAYNNNPIVFIDPYGDDPPTAKQLQKKLKKIGNELERKTKKAMKRIAKQAADSAPLNSIDEAMNLEKWKQYASDLSETITDEGVEIEQWFEGELNKILKHYGEKVKNWHFAGVTAGVGIEADFGPWFASAGIGAKIGDSKYKAVIENVAPGSTAYTPDAAPYVFAEAGVNAEFKDLFDDDWYEVFTDYEKWVKLMKMSNVGINLAGFVGGKFSAEELIQPGGSAGTSTLIALGVSINGKGPWGGSFEATVDPLTLDVELTFKVTYGLKIPLEDKKGFTIGMIEKGSAEYVFPSTMQMALEFVDMYYRSKYAPVNVTAPRKSAP